MKKDLELKPEDLKDKDILITLGMPPIFLVLLTNLGGDGTYLRSAAMVGKHGIPMLGINTDPKRSIGHLCDAKIYRESKK